MTDVIVTGLPRSGSATVAALIDYLPDAVSLNTPPWQLAIARKPLDILPYCKWLAGDFIWTRRVMLDSEPIGDYRTGDCKPFFDGAFDPGQKLFFIRPGLTKDCILAMRQTTLFTSILPTLVTFKHFKVIAVIRHPLDVIRSWQRLPPPFIDRTHAPGLERYWPELLAITEAKSERLDRFAQMYDAYLQRYHEVREHITIVKYEDIVENPLLISRFLGRDTVSYAARFIEKRPRILASEETNILRESFRKYGVFTRLYYQDI